MLIRPETTRKWAIRALSGLLALFVAAVLVPFLQGIAGSWEPLKDPLKTTLWLYAKIWHNPLIYWPFCSVTLFLAGFVAGQWSDDLLRKNQIQTSSTSTKIVQNAESIQSIAGKKSNRVEWDVWEKRTRYTIAELAHILSKTDPAGISENSQTTAFKKLIMEAIELKSLKCIAEDYEDYSGVRRIKNLSQNTKVARQDALAWAQHQSFDISHVQGVLAHPLQVGATASLVKTNKVPTWIENKVKERAKNEPKNFSKRTAAELLGYYDNLTALQANKLIEPHFGEWISVSGTILMLLDGGKDVVAVLRHEGLAFECRFPKDHETELLKYQKGDRLTAIGRISEGQNGQQLYLRDCELASSVRQPS